ETLFLAEIKYRISAQTFRDHGPRDRNCCGGGARAAPPPGMSRMPGSVAAPDGKALGRLAKIKKAKRQWPYGAPEGHLYPTSSPPGTCGLGSVRYGGEPQKAGPLRLGRQGDPS